MIGEQVPPASHPKQMNKKARKKLDDKMEPYVSKFTYQVTANQFKERLKKERIKKIVAQELQKVEEDKKVVIEDNEELKKDNYLLKMKLQELTNYVEGSEHHIKQLQLENRYYVTYIKNLKEKFEELQEKFNLLNSQTQMPTLPFPLGREKSPPLKKSVSVTEVQRTSAIEEYDLEQSELFDDAEFNNWLSAFPSPKKTKALAEESASHGVDSNSKGSPVRLTRITQVNRVLFTS